MPPRREIERSIYGVWRIVLRDPDAPRYFNVTADGFWRSFFAAAIVAPLYLLQILLAQDLIAADVNVLGFTSYLLVQAVVFVFTWVGFVILMVPVTRLLNLEASYAAFVIVWNWSQVLKIALVVLVLLLRSLGLMAGGIGQVLLFTAFLAALYIAFLVARAGLGCDIPTAIGVVVGEILLQFSIERFSAGLLG